MAKRSYGTGRPFARVDSGGREHWYGTWWAGGVRVKRKIGLKRKAGTSDGLTRVQAEAELRRRIATDTVVAAGRRRTVQEAGEAYITDLETVMERKRTTIADYRGYLRKHLGPFFGGRPLDEIDRAYVEQYLLARRREGLSAKTIQEPPQLPPRDLGVLDQARVGDREPGRARRPAASAALCPPPDPLPRRLRYGNRRVGDVAGRFWLDGPLAITARDQVRFLRRLARGTLPVSRRAQQQVGDLLVLEREGATVLRGKTGYVFTTAPRVGWWVGWVQRRATTWAFALNLDVTRPEHLAARTTIGRAVLAELGALR